MQVTARQIADMIGGMIEGNEDALIVAPSKIEEGTPKTITFLANMKYEPFIYTTQASAVLVPSDFVPKQPIFATLIRVPDVYASIGILLERFASTNQAVTRKIAASCIIHDTANLGTSAHIGDFTIIEEGVSIAENAFIATQVFIGKNVRIGKNVTIYSGVKILHDCEIGDDCTIHANVVIGSDGFGFAPQSDGTYKKVPQIGNVVLGNNVDIGANTTIDRATMGSTRIGNGVKLDNLVQIAHNVVIGDNTVIAAQAGVAGSTKIGKNCMIGGQVGIAGHLQIADGTKIQAQTGVATTVKTPNTALFGSPAMDYSQFIRSFVVFKQLPELLKRISNLEKNVKK